MTAKLICAFVFAYANCLFSYAAAHIKVVSFEALKSFKVANNIY